MLSPTTNKKSTAHVKTGIVTSATNVQYASTTVAELEQGHHTFTTPLPTSVLTILTQTATLKMGGTRKTTNHSGRKNSLTGQTSSVGMTLDVFWTRNSSP